MSLFLSFSLLVGVSTTAFAEEKVDTLKGIILADNGHASIEYIPDAQGYYLENVTVEEVLAAFDSNQNYEKVNTKDNYSLKNNRASEEFIENSNKVLKEKGIDVKNVKAGSYKQDYNLYVNVPGVYGDNVRVTQTVNMVMTTVTYQGKSYAKFVSINLDQTYSLGSGYYSFYSGGTNTPKAYITNAGATLNVDQTIQIETTDTISTDIGISAGWISFGSSSAGEYKYRNKSITYYSKYNLPLINIVT